MKHGRDDWKDEDLVAWLLDSDVRADQPREQLETLPGVRERLGSYEEFLKECRAELHASEALAPEPRVKSMNDEILRRTTGEDVSVGGDLRLVGRFLMQSLRTSVLLRVVAASLLVHIAALPVLAYYTWVAPAPTTRIEFDISGAPRELPYREADPEPVLESEDSLAAESARDEERALDALTRSSAAELFRARLRDLGLTDPDGPAAEASPEARVWGGSLGLVLRVEMLLDEARTANSLQAERRREHLHFALARLREAISDLEAREDRPALRQLTASSWLRARAEGLAEEDRELTVICARRLGALTGDSSYLEGLAWQSVFESALLEGTSPASDE